MAKVIDPSDSGGNIISISCNSNKTLTDSFAAGVLSSGNLVLLILAFSLSLTYESVLTEIYEVMI